MWSYNYTDDQTDYLAHKNGFKYIARIKQGKGFRYFYDMSEYKAYLNTKNQPLTTVAKKPRLSNTLKNTLSNIKDLISKGKEKFDITDKLKDTLSDSKEVVDKGREKFLDFLDKQNQKKEEKKNQKEKELEEKKRAEEEKKQAEQKRLDDLRKKEGTEFLDDNLAHKEKEMTSDEDRKQVNPNYSPYDYGYSNNCAYCTAAWDLRKRGYDVEAESVDYETANTTPEILSWYEPTPETTNMYDLCEDVDIYVDDSRNGQFVNPGDIAKGITKDILKQGDGARGTFLLYWPEGGGHSVAYEVRGDKVVLVDSQVNVTLNIEDYLSYANNFSYFRLDDCKPNEKILKTCHSKNSKAKRR